MPAYVTVPQAIFLILQRIGQTPLQQVKQVRTMNQPTGAKAGLLATIISVAGFAYSQIPGVSDLVGNVGTYVNDAIKAATGPIDQVMGGALSSLSFNPPAELFSEGLNLSESIRTFQPPIGSGLDFSGLISNAGTAAKALIQDLQKHTSYLSNVTQIPLTAQGNFPAGDWIDQNMAVQALESKASILGNIQQELGDVANKLVDGGKMLAGEVTGYIDKGVNFAHENLMKITEGKIGLFDDPAAKFNSLDKLGALELRTLLDKAYTMMQDPATTQAMLNQVKEQIDAKTNELSQNMTSEKLLVNGINRATATIGAITDKANAIGTGSPATDLLSKTINPNTLPVISQINQLTTKIEEAKTVVLTAPTISLSLPPTG